VTTGEILKEAEGKMKRAVEVTKEDFASFRTGRAAPGLVEKLHVDYYGAETPLQQLANITVPENRVLLINVYDKTAVSSVEKAIRESDLGLNPSTDGNTVRLMFPPLTGERRKELVKLVKSKSEDGKVAVRNVRRHSKDHMEHLEKDHEISQDELHRSEKELQQLTDRYTSQIDELFKHKERELVED